MKRPKYVYPVEPAPFNNKIIKKEYNEDGTVRFAEDSEGNTYSSELGDWGLTLMQKVKMDGLNSIPKYAQKMYREEKARKAAEARWAKQRKQA